MKRINEEAWNKLKNEIIENLKNSNPMIKAVCLIDEIADKIKDLKQKIETMEAVKLKELIQSEEEFLNKINEILEDDINE